jgi:4-hydroxybenzoate polyprenyltransferase
MSSESLTVRARETAAGLVRETRPHQWYKQGVLLLGIVFSRRLFDAVAWAEVAVAVAAFTAVAGATYVFNDISDLEADRNHPRKRHRPIASGQVPVGVAAAFAAALFVGGLAAAYAVNVYVLAAVLAYLGQNVIEERGGKGGGGEEGRGRGRGGGRREEGGALAIEVFLSPWLIVCTFLAALVLALGKRRHELAEVADPTESRRSLGAYTREELDQLLVASMAALLMAYALYTFFRADPAMMLTLPFAVYGVFRYHYLVHTTAVAANPGYLLTDLPSVLNLGVWLLVAVSVLYRVPQQLGGVLP